MQQTFFRPASAQAAFEQWYDRQLDQLPQGYDLLRIETSFGDTQIIRIGNPQRPPLLILHEADACAPLALQRFGGLAEDFCLYAVDLIGEPGLSAAYRPEDGESSYGQWLFELLSRLRLRQLTLVGQGQGAYAALHVALLDQRHIARLVLVHPLGLAAPKMVSLYLRQHLPKRLFRWRKKDRYLDRYLEALYTDPGTCDRAMLARILLYFRADRRTVPVLKAEDLQRIRRPVSLVLSTEDLQAPAWQVLEKGPHLFKQLERTLLLTDGKHIPDAAGYRQIIQLIQSLTHES